jgi:hypothetical protein
MRVNARPIATPLNRMISVTYGKAATFALPGYDPDGQPAPLRFEVVNPPQHGTFHLDAATGTGTYTAELNPDGNDRRWGTSFTYRVCDGPSDAPWTCSQVATAYLLLDR